MNLNEETQRFLEWINIQIELSVYHNTCTVVSWLVESRSGYWQPNEDFIDALCYEIVESFCDVSDYDTLKELRIYWNILPSNEKLSDLLLVIPIRFLQMMIDLSKNHENAFYQK